MHPASRHSVERPPPSPGRHGFASVTNKDTRIGARLQRVLPLAILGAAVALGLAVRLRHLLVVDFPLNDGGLFYTMARDIQTHGYALPAEASYNVASIPFAYPPLSFYVAAIADDLTPLDLFDVFRFLPLVANLLTIGAFFLLCRAILPSKLMVAIAVPFFALLPRSYRWLIMGGGVARALGFLFALLAIHQAYLLYTTGRRRFALSTALLAAATVLSHTETAWFVFFTLALLWLSYGRSRAGVMNSGLVAGGVLLLTCPWWITVIARDGLSPLLAAAQTGGYSWDAWRAFLSWEFTEQPYLNWPAVLALVGGVLALADGKPFLPLWLGAIMLLDPRAGPTYATAPLAMLVATGVAGIIVPLWNRRSIPTPATDGRVAPHRPAAFAWLGPLLPKLAAVTFVGYIAILAVRSPLLEDGLLRGVSQNDREAMAWVAENSPADSRFAVLTDVVPAWVDAVSEWFPALTGRVSVATPQGHEWIGKEELDAQIRLSYSLQSCARQEVRCLEDWASASDVAFTHVYIDRDCCATLEESLRSSTRYRLAGDLPGAAVFVREPQLVGESARTWFDLSNPIW
jgi:hypothetical protein